VTTEACSVQEPTQLLDTQTGYDDNYYNYNYNNYYYYYNNSLDKCLPAAGDD